jgi:hypothetical protein
VRPLARYRGWFFAAAIYNAVWGTGAIVVAQPAGWRVVGMFVLVYAPAYWWVARRPAQHPHLVAIALLGKILGPTGFVYAAATGQLPPVYGLMILTNDVLWWPAFAAYLRTAARARGGWRAFLAGE